MDTLFSEWSPVAVILVAALAVAALSIPIQVVVGRIQQHRQQVAQALTENGIQGTATVTGLVDTGIRVRGNPRVKIDLQIELPGYPAYEVTKTVIIPLIQLPQVQVGQQVTVFVDPNDTENPDRIVVRLR